MATREFLDRLKNLGPKQLALLALELQEQVERQAKPAVQPIAIVGMACRFPGGANSPEAYWRMLSEGIDAIRETPADRWDVNAYYDPNPDAPGKIATRWGGFLDDIDRFDADFFGIAPREAVNMDPQQRLVLEVAWEAIERAGYAPDSLERTRTGVFLGICNSDYFQQNASGDSRKIDAYLASGGAASVASGRLSYLLGLQGPSISVDTACSSSLVAVHLACQSLRSGESTLAIAGGVNVILRPEVSMTLSRAHMMASDGRCKAFDSRADGFVRAEGCGLVVLKRLADAQAAGDNILAVIRASASNQDGRSSGITAPNGPAQEAVIRDALANADLRPADITYVEAHGTGTALGDPIEIQALGAAFAAGRAANSPLLVGSVKTNVGHLESAAGIAGLMKVVLSLHHRTIPPHLHLREPNPHVDWSQLPVAVPTKSTPWPAGARALAGVSSFGFSGTNAHVILEAAPPKSAQSEGSQRLPHVLPLAASSEAALLELARDYARHLEDHPEEAIADLCYTASVGRAHFEHRLAIVAAERATLASRLKAAAEGSAAANIVRGRGASPPEFAFLFSGQGSQYPGMGRELYACEPVFRRVIDECEAAVAGLLAKPLSKVLFESDRAELERTENLQPALFALEVALAELWRSWGVVPSVVMGHSVGEYAAACVAGVFEPADGARLVAARARLMQAVRGSGCMAAVLADEATVRDAIAGAAGQVVIAAINAPDQIVISGYTLSVDAVLRALESRGIAVHRLDVSHAFHSPQMDEMLADFEVEARRVTFREPRMGIVSNVTGELWSASELRDGAAYWRRHLRSAVRFAQGMTTLERQGCRVFVEIGPNPVLVGMGARCLGAGRAEWLASLRKDRGEREQIVETVARLYAQGAKIDWAGFATPDSHRRLVLPTYPFQRRRYWMSHPPAAAQSARALPMRSATDHPLKCARLDSPLPTYECALDLTRLRYLAHHRVGGRAVAPGALLLEMVRATGATFLKSEDVRVEDVRFREMLALPDSGERRVNIVFTDVTSGNARFSVYSRAGEGADLEWVHHVDGSVDNSKVPAAPKSETLESIRERCSEPLSTEDFYSSLEARGLDFGACFRGIVELHGGSSEVLGRIRLPEDVGHASAVSAPYRIHPALLDAGMQLLGVAMTRGQHSETFMQVGQHSMNLLRTAPNELWGVASLRGSVAGGEIVGDVRLFDDNGEAVAVLEGVKLKQVPASLLAPAHSAVRQDWLYEVAWRRDRGSVAAVAFGQIAPLATQLRNSLAPLAIEHGLDKYDALSPQIERAAALHVARAIREMGLPLKPGTRVTTEAMRTDGRVLPSFARLFERMLRILAEEGVIRAQGAGAWDVIGALPAGDAQVEHARLASAFPGFDAELGLLARCGVRLAEVLQGSQDPLQLLFPGGDASVLEGLYRDSPSAHVYNHLVRRAVSELVASRPVASPLRVLEIGAGTGSTTHYLLPVLPEGTEYVFTDISPSLVARATRRFADTPAVNCQVFDVDDKTPLEQGFVRHTFDLIIAANVLHATRDLKRTLSRVHELLRPGGVLVMLEGTRSLRWVDLTFGMTEGWWRFSDRELRPLHPLLAPEQWKTLLETSGFADASAAPDRVEPAGQTLVLARAVSASQPEAIVAKESASWVVCTDTVERGRTFAAACRSENIQCVVVTRDSAPTEFALARATAIVFLAAAGTDGDPTSQVENDALTATAWLRAIAATRSAARLWVVTQGAQPVNGGSVAHFRQAGMWGWGRVAALEYADAFGGLLDTDPSVEEVDIHAIREAIVAADDEDQIALRGGERFVARLNRAAPSGTTPFVWRDDHTYIVTGWMGGLGLLLVKWLAERGARHLVLIGRRDLSEGASAASADAVAAVAQLRASGVTPTIVKANVADATEMAALFARFESDLPPLAGVFHAAADLSSGSIDDLNASQYRRMLSVKAGCAWVLHELTKGRALDCFVLFSSTTALWGAQGLAHYAAANQLLDGLAHWRRGQGLPALSINWGTWEAMRLASEESQALYASAGLQPMPAADALEMLEYALRSGRPQVAVAAVDWDTLKPVYEARRARPFLREVETLRAAATQSSGSGAASEAWRFDDIGESQRAEVLGERVRAEVASVLGLADAAEVDPTRGLFDMGMDSLMAVELRARLERRAGRSLPSTLTFNYPNVNALAGFFTQQLLVSARAAEPEPAAVEASESRFKPVNRDEMSEDELETLLAERLKAL
ncbi:MAG: SDR family NAD(P)-dependent oxidoreductase [Gammaproteobacteria bacterium]